MIVIRRRINGEEVKRTDNDKDINFDEKNIYFNDGKSPKLSWTRADFFLVQKK